MARIYSACSREAVALGRRLAEGWDRFSSAMSRAASPLRVAYLAEASPEPARTSQSAAETLSSYREPDTLALPAPAAIAQSGAFLDLMAQISHDLRTPLNAVIGFSDVMSAELLGPVGHPRYREYAGDIRDSGRRLLKAAEDTLAMTSMVTQSTDRLPRVLNLAELLNDAWGTCEDDASSRQIAITRSGIPDDLQVSAPAHPLRQALVNLLAEAMTRARDGGAIDIIAEPDADTVRLEFHVAAPAVRPRTSPGSLPINLARTLLGLQGAGLLEIPGRDGSWRVVTVLDRAVQHDFFAKTRGGEVWGMTPHIA